MSNNVIRQDYGSLENDVQTQMLIAPVLAEMVATQTFAIGDRFIVNNTLYKATKAIAIGDTISVGTSASDNCVLSDMITQQIKVTPWMSLVSGVIYRKVGNIVFISISGVSASPGVTNLGTLPKGYRPTNTIRFVTWGSSSPSTGTGIYGAVYVLTTGEISGLLPTGGDAFLGTFSFPLG